MKKPEAVSVSVGFLVVFVFMFSLSTLARGFDKFPGDCEVCPVGGILSALPMIFCGWPRLGQPFTTEDYNG